MSSVGFGPAGNSFGQKTQFRCGGGQRCVLLKADPLYADFAHERHLAAVRGTLRALFALQSSAPPEVADAP